MAYERPSLQTILDRIEADLEARLTGDSALLRHGVLRVLARVFAGAVHVTYGYLEFISRQIFVSTAEREYLERHGIMWGVPRKAAAFAAGELTFYGVDTTPIPVGTKVQTEDGVEYETTAGGSIGDVTPGELTVAASAVEAGADANTSAPDPDVELIEPISGVTSVDISTSFAGGVDAETDEEYRERILERIQNPPAGGTAADYVIWAESVSGVDQAWCYPATPGPGQVTVIFRGAASTSTVEDYISDLMPVTTDLTVDKPTEKTIDFALRIKPNTSELRDAIEENVGQLFEDVARPGDELLISQVRNAISTAGVEDYVIDSITGTTQDADGNLLFTGFDYPVLGTITFSLLT